ncbi:MAG TPA: MFS transporter [Streptosporangiaceae bacterium]|nr:MFS transporter [Streptosporangiaceae bacterium]
MTGASGARRTGLSNLIELTAASSVGDAFVAVALAGTLFFNASVSQARSQVVIALLVTMAPFAVLAPLIGPLLDRLQQGRRFILAGTLLARGALCWGMAGAVFYHDSVTLLPAAFGVLVLQKAYGVTRSAITPRLLPREITLVTANARTGLASLVASTLGVALAAGLEYLTGGGSGGAAWVLRVGTVIYLAAMALCFRVPEQVDLPLEQEEPGPSPATVPLASEPPPTRPYAGEPPRTRPYAGEPPPARPYAGEPSAAPPRAGQHRTAYPPPPGDGQGPRQARRNGNGAEPPPPRTRWRTLRQLGPIVGEAMRANASLRAFSGFMIFFLAFLLRTVHFPGVTDKAALAGMIAAAGAGGFLGSALGSALKTRRPLLITFGILALSTVVTALCAVYFGLWAALVVALVAAFGQVLSKLALDSTVQQEIGEEIRTSAFAASETLNQLSWVAGGLLGVLLSLTNSGVAGLTVAAAGLGVSFILLVLHRRRRILAARKQAPRPPGRGMGAGPAPAR